MVARGSLQLSSPNSGGKMKRLEAVLLPKFHAFVYACIQMAVSVLMSFSGHSMRGAEKERRDGRHMPIRRKD